MDTTVSLKLPPKNYRRTIEELSVVIPDPVLKLKFLKQAINEHQKISAPYKLYPPIAEITFRKRLLNNAENICPGSKKAAKQLLRKGVISAPGIRWRWLYKLYYIFVSAILILFILRLGTAVFPLVRNFNFGTLINVSPQQVETANTKIIIRKPIGYSQLPGIGGSPKSSIFKSANYQNKAEQVSWNYKNPILTALISQQTKIPRPEPIFQKPLVAFHYQNNRNHKPISTVKSVKHRNKPELVLNYYKNPILTTLISQQTNNSKSGPIDQILLLSAQSQSKGKHLPIPTAKPVKHQKELEPALNAFQNPILTALTSQQIFKSTSEPISKKTLMSSKPRSSRSHLPLPTTKPAEHSNKPIHVAEYLKDPIWLVEKTADREFYSNRLQIITTYTISNIPREYYRFSRNSDYSPANSKTTNKISGIVYHASESDLYPFMPEMNRSILSYSKRLIKYLLRKKSYHFFIDRFGRVYRLVQEDHAAFHAGKSIWADDETLYLNLNHAFIGICFEGKDFEEIRIENQKRGNATKSKATRLKPTGISSFNEAQLRSGKELTDWLRLKYKISQHNCVPHALISINPDKMLIGWHLDLCRGFPFAKFGLSNKYREPLPSIVEFGFRYDAYFKKIFNHDIWPGIGYSEEIIEQRARNSDMQFAEYRESLHRRFSLYAEWNKKMLERKDQLAGNLPKTMGK